MQWAAERKCLEVMKRIPTKNSSLKKKLAIVKKLKAMPVDDFDQLLTDIKTENLQKFYSEIVDGLISPTRARLPEDIHKITAVLWLYSGDPTFTGLLSTALRKSTFSGWVQAAIATEVYYMFHGEISSICSTILQNNGFDSIPYINYVLDSFENLNTKIFEESVRKELKLLNEKNITMLQSICEKLGWEERPVLPLNYKEVIKQDENEFIFYTRPPSDKTRTVTAGDVKRLESHATDIDFLDSFGRGIVDSPELIQRILKKRKHKELIPAIARILTHLKKTRTELLTKLLEKPVKELSLTDILMLCEMCKFDSVKGTILLSRAEQLLKEQEIAKLCGVIEGAGRFLLIQRDTNEGMRGLLASLTSTCLSDTETIMVNDALAKLYNISSPRISPLDFFQWLFQERNFHPDGVFMRVATSPRLLALLFSHPHTFPSTQFVASLIFKTGMQDVMLSLYTSCLGEVYKHSKQSAFLFVNISAILLSYQTVCKQSEVIESIFSRKLPKDAVHAMVLSLLECADPGIHSKYLAQIKEQKPSTRTRTLLFNFCEKHGYSSFDHDIDSFEQEMEFMKEI